MRARIAKLVIFGLLVMSTGVAIGQGTSPQSETSSQPVAFRDFMRDVDAHKIAEVTITGQQVSWTYGADNQSFHTFAPPHHEGLADKLQQQGVVVIKR